MSAKRRWESPIIWCVRASRAKSFRTIESVGAEPARLRFEVFQCLAPIAPLDGDRAQVEEHKRVVRPVLQLTFQNLGIAVDLPGTHSALST